MINWFPLSRSMMEESQEFKGLTVAEKLYYILVLSEFNLKGEFYRADLEMAIMLRLSEDKIRRARRKLQGMEFLTIKPGFKSKGKGVATTYIDAKWRETPKRGDGEYFAPMHRYALETMLHYIRVKRFNHADVLTYIYLCYYQYKNRGKNEGKFFITKETLKELTGIPKAVECVTSLYKGFVFDEKSHLFDYRDMYHKLVFDVWRTMGDPKKGANLTQADTYKQEVAKLVSEAKEIKALNDKDYSGIKPEQLPEIYKKWIIGSCYALGPKQKIELIALGTNLGAAKVAKGIDIFMSNTGSKSFPDFRKSCTS